MQHLAIVRRLEALGFRAWPAASVHYDGSWQMRLTASHPSRRLNSVNPLDPSDYGSIGRRVEQAARRFSGVGRPLVFRQTPLAATHLDAFFDDHDWSRLDETRVMMANIGELQLEDALDHLPIRDLGRYVDAALLVHGRDAAMRPGLTEVLSSIRPETGFFVIEEEGSGPVATVLCVHDNDMSGLFELATRSDKRRQGFGREVVTTALRWARLSGASKVWLQVETDNHAAVALYEGFGFRDVYRYHYRQAPDLLRQ